MIHSFAVTDAGLREPGIRVVTVVADAADARALLAHIGAAMGPVPAPVDATRAAGVMSAQDLEALPRASVVWAGGFRDDEQHKRTEWTKLADGPGGRWHPVRGAGVSIGNRAGVSTMWLWAQRGTVELAHMPARSEDAQTLDRVPDTP